MQWYIGILRNIIIKNPGAKSGVLFNDIINVKLENDTYILRVAIQVDEIHNIKPAGMCTFLQQLQLWLTAGWGGQGCDASLDLL